jgi:hypothetical protein
MREPSRRSAYVFGGLGGAIVLASAIVVAASRVSYHSPSERLWGHGTCIPEPEFQINVGLNVLAGLLFGLGAAAVTPRHRWVVGLAVCAGAVVLLEVLSILGWRVLCTTHGEG